MSRSSIWVLALLLGCGPKGAQEAPPVDIFEGMDRRTQLRLQSYMANGQRLYNNYCVNCHQKDGTGLRLLIPSLRGADYLTQRSEVACLIKYGSKKARTGSDKQQKATMPANRSLRNIQIAELMSYISNAWGNKAGLIPVKEVNKYLDSCRIQ